MAFDVLWTILLGVIGGIVSIKGSHPGKEI